MISKKGTNMKKFAIVTAMMFASYANAAEVSASYVHDFKAGREGVRVEMPVASILGVKPVLGLTHVNDAYTRYSVGADVQVAKIGPVAVALSGSTVFQDTQTRTGTNGFAVTVGAKASLPLNKSTALVASVDRFIGQERVSNLNGTVSSVGLAVKF